MYIFVSTLIKMINIVGLTFVNQRIIKQNITKLQSDIWLIQILQWYCLGHFCLPFLEGGNKGQLISEDLVFVFCSSKK
mgnify:FL=1